MRLVPRQGRLTSNCTKRAVFPSAFVFELYLRTTQHRRPAISSALSRLVAIELVNIPGHLFRTFRSPIPRALVANPDASSHGPQHGRPRCVNQRQLASPCEFRVPSRRLPDSPCGSD